MVDASPRVAIFQSRISSMLIRVLDHPLRTSRSCLTKFYYGVEHVAQTFYDTSRKNPFLLCVRFLFLATCLVLVWEAIVCYDAAAEAERYGLAVEKRMLPFD